MMKVWKKQSQDAKSNSLDRKGEITVEDLIKDAFYHLNGFKMYRAKCETARHRGNEQAVQENELKMYKAIDQLELSLRGIQRNNRESGE